MNNLNVNVVNDLIIIKTPKLDDILIDNWFNKSFYNLGEQQEIQSLLDNEVWITAQRIKIPVSEMKSQHIINCINCWEGKGKLKISNNYLGGKDKWLKIFKKELDKRFIKY